jgi:predicted ATPase
MAVAKRKVEQGVVSLLQTAVGPEVAQAHAHFLGHLIGLDFGDSRHIQGVLSNAKEIRDRGFYAAALLFRYAQTDHGTAVVLILDDVHWADDGSLDFLAYLAQANRGVPMLVIAFARPTLIERRAGWCSDQWRHRRIDLLPLSTADSWDLANDLLKRLPNVPDTLRNLLTAGAEGNPYYMEELLKMLIDERAIETEGDQWSVHADRLQATRVPQTLTGVLQARLDSLTPPERLALQQASVIGTVFWDQALAAIDEESPRALPGVTRRHFVTPHVHSSLEGAGEYAFRHQILHHVTYDTVLKVERRRYHAKTAVWLATLADTGATSFLGTAAEHFEAAGKGGQACEYFVRAAKHAAERYAHEAVLGYTGRALALADQGDIETHWRLHDVRERTLRLLGRRSEQQTEIETLQLLAEQTNDDRRRGEIAWRHSGFVRSVNVDLLAMEASARKAVMFAERAGDTELWLRAQHRLADSLCDRGEIAAANSVARPGLEKARVEGLRKSEASFLNLLGFIAVLEDQLEASVELSERELQIEREIGDREAEAHALVCLGCTWNSLGQCTLARDYWNEGLRLHRDIGNRMAEAFPLGNLALASLYESNNDQALAYAGQVLEIAMEVDAPSLKAIALSLTAEAELALGRHAEATNTYGHLNSVSHNLGSAKRFDALAGLARVELAMDNVPGALRYVEELMAHRVSGETMEGADEQSVWLTCYRALSSAGDPRAPQLLDSLYTKLHARACRIRDERLRESFLRNIPDHRQVVAAWEASQTR